MGQGGFVDIHCHVLPGIDDGPERQEEAVEMARRLQAIGFERIVATPHDRPPRWEQDPRHLAAARERLQEAIGAGGPSLDVAAENFLDDEGWRRFETDQLIRYPSGKAALFEFAVGRDPLPVGYADRLFQIRVRGLTPVLAHPERYEQLARDPEAVEKLVQGGSVLLISLLSLGGGFFDPIKKVAGRMLRDGIATAAASDAHTVRDVDIVERGIRRLEKLVGPDGLDRVLREVPEGLAGKADE